MKKNSVLLTLTPLTAISLIASLSFTSTYKQASAFSPKDPFYTGDQTISVSGMNVYQNIALGYVGSLENVWNTYKGKGVTVAVIDTGIDINHPDFKGRISQNSAYVSRQGSSSTETKVDIGLQYLAHDYSNNQYVSHGTNTAGVISAGINNGGVVGIAPESTVLAIKVDMYNISVCKAIEYAVDNGADVINISLGSYCEPYINGNTGEAHNIKDKDYFPGADQDFQTPIDYAYEHNVIVVASAGNEKTNVKCYPAANNHVIGVGAFKEYSNTDIASFSNYNDSETKEGQNVSVDLCAPGYVVTTDFKGPKDAGRSTFCQTQGTSFSSPIVAGAACLWKQEHPNGTPDQFKNDLIKSCVDVGKPGWDHTYGYGALNIQNLVSGGKPKNRGCIGNFETTSILLSTISLTGITLIGIKKFKKKEDSN